MIYGNCTDFIIIYNIYIYMSYDLFVYAENCRNTIGRLVQLYHISSLSFLFTFFLWISLYLLSMLFPSMPIKVCLQEVLATLVTVEEAPVKVLKEIATTAMAKVPQLVGVTWSKEPLR